MRRLKRRGSAKPSNNVRFRRVSTLVVSSMLDNAGFFRINLHSSGNKLLCALDTSGVGLIDITDIENPVLLDSNNTLPTNWTYENCRNLVELNATTLASVSRNSDIGVGSNGSGFLRTWDITGDSFSILDTFDALVESPTTNQRYSDIEYDGRYAFVSGQIVSLESFDLSNPSSIVRITEYIPGDGLETQGVALSGGYSFWANYGDPAGDIAVTPIVAGVIGTPVFTPRLTYKAVTQRSFNNVIDGNFMYCSIIETANRAQSGLQIYDISNPAIALPRVGHAPIPTLLGHADPDDLGGAGDEPNMGIFKFENLIFLANGHRGIVVIDVTDPTNPIVLGTFGILPVNENIKTCCVFRKDGKIYCVYGSGNSVEAVNYKTLYIDEVILP